MQYVFETKSIEGKSEFHVVQWDYTIGLVRMTPFFKVCGWSKVG